MNRAIRKLLHLLDQLLDFGSERHVEKRWLDRPRVDDDRDTKLTARTITGKRWRGRILWPNFPDLG